MRTKLPQHWLEKDAYMVKKATPILQKNALTISYYDMMNNLEGEMQKICNYLDLEWNEENKQQIKEINKRNKQHKYGVHKYDLKDFGLEKESIDEAFSSYRKEFNIPHE